MIDYINFVQGDQITLKGFKHFLREVDDCHERELEDALKCATLYVQEYLNAPLVQCSVKLNVTKPTKNVWLPLDNFENVKVTDVNGNPIAFTQVGDTILLNELKSVIVTYDCRPMSMATMHSQLVFEVGAAVYDGQPEQVQKILKNHPKAL